MEHVSSDTGLDYIVPAYDILQSLSPNEEGVRPEDIIEECNDALYGHLFVGQIPNYEYSPFKKFFEENSPRNIY